MVTSPLAFDGLLMSAFEVHLFVAGCGGSVMEDWHGGRKLTSAVTSWH